MMRPQRHLLSASCRSIYWAPPPALPRCSLLLARLYIARDAFQRATASPRFLHLTGQPDQSPKKTGHHAFVFYFRFLAFV